MVITKSRSGLSNKQLAFAGVAILAVIVAIIAISQPEIFAPIGNFINPTCSDKDAYLGANAFYNSSYVDYLTYVKTGTKQTRVGRRLTDYCANSTVLMEAVCKTTRGVSSGAYDEKICKIGCKDGACVNNSIALLENPVKQKFSCAGIGGVVINGMCYKESICNTSLSNELFSVTINMSTRNYQVGDKTQLMLTVKNKINSSISLVIGNDLHGIEFLERIELRSQYFEIENIPYEVNLLPFQNKTYVFNLTAIAPSKLEVPIKIRLYYTYSDNTTIGNEQWNGCGIVTYAIGDIKCGDNYYDSSVDYPNSQCIDGIFYPDFMCTPYTISVPVINGKISFTESYHPTLCLGFKQQEIHTLQLLKGNIELVYLPVNVDGYPALNVTDIQRIAINNTQRMNEWYYSQSNKLFGRQLVHFNYSVWQALTFSGENFLTWVLDYINNSYDPNIKRSYIVISPNGFSPSVYSASTGVLYDSYGKQIPTSVDEYQDFIIDNKTSTVIHEMLHGFGAVDLYRYSSLSWRLCPDGMMSGYVGNDDLANRQLDKELCLTSYEVGWSDLNNDSILDVDKNPFEEFINPDKSCGYYGGVCDNRGSVQTLILPSQS